MTKTKIFLIAIAVIGITAVAGPWGATIRAERDNSNAKAAELRNKAETENENDSGLDKSAEVENELENESSNQPLLSIKPQGDIRIQNAALLSNSGQSLQLKSFGLNLTVGLTSSTELIGVIANASGSSSFSDMKTGDVIDVWGTIDSNSGLITAEKIRDDSLRQQGIDALRQQIESLLQQLRQLQEQLRVKQGGND